MDITNLGNQRRNLLDHGILKYEHCSVSPVKILSKTVVARMARWSFVSLSVVHNSSSSEKPSSISNFGNLLSISVLVLRLSHVCSPYSSRQYYRHSISAREINKLETWLLTSSMTPFFLSSTNKVSNVMALVSRALDMGLQYSFSGKGMPNWSSALQASCAIDACPRPISVRSGSAKRV